MNDETQENIEAYSEMRRDYSKLPKSYGGFAIKEIGKRLNHQFKLRARERSLPPLPRK